jgi:hypothetical protein
MLELFFGEASRATSHCPHCRRHDDPLPEAIDQTVAVINPYVERWRLSGSAWPSDRPRGRVTTIGSRSTTVADPVTWGRLDLAVSVDQRTVPFVMSTVNRTWQAGQATSASGLPTVLIRLYKSCKKARSEA